MYSSSKPDSKLKFATLRKQAIQNYRPPSQDDETEDVLHKQLGEVSQLLPLVLMGDFNFPDMCWEYNAAEREHS